MASSGVQDRYEVIGVPFGLADTFSSSGGIGMATVPPADARVLVTRIGTNPQPALAFNVLAARREDVLLDIPFTTVEELIWLGVLPREPAA